MHSTPIRTGGYFDEIKKIEQIRREELRREASSHDGLKQLQRELAKLETTEKNFQAQTNSRFPVPRKAPSR